MADVASTSPILRRLKLGFPWETADPFLFCVHHEDAYPRGNDRLGPDTSLAGRSLGMDFEGKDGWRMYHGEHVPGFPQHPHRGFETVTILRKGVIDHSDSLGATARFGAGDVQWLTAGKGIVHCEMFPLLHTERDNPVELFQIWLNLPRAEKMAEPHFAMMWNENVPRVASRDALGRRTTVTLVAGALQEHKPLSPPPHSWASKGDSDVAIWVIELEPGAQWSLPQARAGSHRALYFFRGGRIKVGGTEVEGKDGLLLRSDVDVVLSAGDEACELLLLQGRPIGEPVAQHGPFVMNSPAEIQQAFLDYQRTRFGGWPWRTDEPVHAPDAGRHAKYPDGRVERPGG